jgi:hypothetical protein
MGGSTFLIYHQHQASVLSSVISPLDEFICIEVVEDPIRTVMQKIIEELKQVSVGLIAPIPSQSQ